MAGVGRIKRISHTQSNRGIHDASKPRQKGACALTDMQDRGVGETKQTEGRIDQLKGRAAF